MIVKSDGSFAALRQSQFPVSRTLDNPPVDGANQSCDDHEDANDRDNTEEENGGHTHAESRA